MCTTPPFRRICRESYSDPAEVFAYLRHKGMDLVTLTDHDSIGGAESLRRHPEFFLSEEVTCRMPSGATLHMGVYDITERQHLEIQRRRDDLPCLLAYLTERRLLFSVKHILSSLTGERHSQDFSWFERYFPAVETCNGQMLPFHNRQAERFAARTGKIRLAGSDSHTLRSVGSAYTEVPGARNKDEFFQGLRARKSVVRGEDGGYYKLTRDVLSIGAQMMENNPWTALLAPLAVLTPFVTLVSMLQDLAFARRWVAHLETAPAPVITGCDSDGLSFPRVEKVFAWQ